MAVDVAVAVAAAVGLGSGVGAAVGVVMAVTVSSGVGGDVGVVLAVTVNSGVGGDVGVAVVVTVEVAEAVGTGEGAGSGSLPHAISAKAIASAMTAIIASPIGYSAPPLIWMLLSRNCKSKSRAPYPDARRCASSQLIPIH